MATESRAGDGASRFAWESHTRPLVESVINEAFPRLYDLRWTADCKSEIHLDRMHGVDIIGIYTSGQSLTFQAKVLTGDYTTLTVEGGNRHTGQPGDWCECIADYLVYLYSHDGWTIERWAVVSRPLLAVATAEGRIKWRMQSPDSSRHNAGSSFYHVGLAEVTERAPECLRSFAGAW